MQEFVQQPSFYINNLSQATQFYKDYSIKDEERRANQITDNVSLKKLIAIPVQSHFRFFMNINPMNNISSTKLDNIIKFYNSQKQHLFSQGTFYEVYILESVFKELPSQIFQIKYYISKIP
ncbi:hypothetical protein TTHERM_00290750 (macronuclear) [Tetrahymena thermophila SB210]|uniref:Uncharacterized protein n=1 Tax=Tetrahymena thermophila (strain SB210) TaxID=312017 RepID=I7MKH7_TETTS|nr:hypothetical protein TTHERM_00290750 [Tetrahymena thermophila SB210]EAR98447.1 hypothetical protein TTHERM_00290750 [Tetrahymena thermophila SB210]|eukprot:XP_001018692.1 hypothetical protein TTHERM_00290750 [Tetrahymena thermophila SB210]